ncbi:HD domain-containing protein [Myxococcota bacterium]|nr:HD domain-containing protein [Myxococcota bacterium]
MPKAEKAQREREALAAMLAPLPNAEALTTLAEEYGLSAEGRFVKALDKLDMLLQARRYAEAQGVNTEEFVASALAALDGEWAGLTGELP